jgi:hypothetical protein
MQVSLQFQEQHYLYGDNDPNMPKSFNADKANLHSVVAHERLAWPIER